MVGSWLASPSVFSPGNHPCHKSNKTFNWSKSSSKPSSISRICKLENQSKLPQIIYKLNEKIAYAEQIQLTFDINPQHWFKHTVCDSHDFETGHSFHDLCHNILTSSYYIFSFLPTFFRFKLVLNNKPKTLLPFTLFPQESTSKLKHASSCTSMVQSYKKLRIY